MEKELIIFTIVIIIFFTILHSNLVRKYYKTVRENYSKLNLEKQKNLILFEAYAGVTNFSKFVSLFKDVSEDVFLDPSIVKVIKEELKRNFNNVYDFMAIDIAINQLPKESKFMFELFFVKVCKDIDKAFFKNLYKEAVNTQNEEAKKKLESLCERINLEIK
jgi:hypothetical protein